MMSEDGLLPYERQVWRRLIEAGEAWRVGKTAKAARAFTAAAKPAWKVPVPQPRGLDALRGARGLLDAAGVFHDLSAEGREQAWPAIAARLADLAAHIGDDPAPAPSVAPREPAPGWWLDGKS